jgi:hypothetical protein
VATTFAENHAAEIRSGRYRAQVKSNASSIYDFVERAKRCRDGSPLERLTMDIEDAERHCSGSP